MPQACTLDLLELHCGADDELSNHSAHQDVTALKASGAVKGCPILWQHAAAQAMLQAEEAAQTPPQERSSDGAKAKPDEGRVLPRPADAAKLFAAGDAELFLHPDFLAHARGKHRVTAAEWLAPASDAGCHTGGVRPPLFAHLAMPDGAPCTSARIALGHAIAYCGCYIVRSTARCPVFCCSCAERARSLQSCSPCCTCCKQIALSPPGSSVHAHACVACKTMKRTHARAANKLHCNVQTERYAFDTCSTNSTDFAAVSIQACAVGSGASMLNRPDGFHVSPRDASKAKANAKFETISVCGLPVVLVQAIQNIRRGERLLLTYSSNENFQAIEEREADEVHFAIFVAKLPQQY